jgi:hypothetical protein
MVGNPNGGSAAIVGGGRMIPSALAAISGGSGQRRGITTTVRLVRAEAWRIGSRRRDRGIASAGGRSKDWRRRPAIRAIAINALGTIDPLGAADAVAIGKITVGGSVLNAMILTGYSVDLVALNPTRKLKGESRALGGFDDCGEHHRRRRRFWHCQ